LLKKNSWQRYLVNFVLACGVMYYVLDLSSPGRTVIDWVVIAAVAGAISWNIAQAVRYLINKSAGDDQE
jgi:hypothetical protein